MIHLILTTSINYRIANYVKNKYDMLLDLKAGFINEQRGLVYI